MWSNTISKPLTAENLLAVVESMTSLQGAILPVVPDTIIVPPALLWEWVRLRLADTKKALRRAEKLLRKPLLSGGYQKRRRQRIDGVGARRSEKMTTARRQLPRLRQELAIAQREYDEAVARGYVTTLPHGFL